MHAIGTRALGMATVSRATRRIVVPPRARPSRSAARAFGSSSSQLESSSSSSSTTPTRPSSEVPSDKPPEDEADTEANAARNELVRDVDEAEKQVASSARRGRLNKAAGVKTRQAKRGVADHFPPFELPKAFLEKHVRRFDEQHEPRSAFWVMRCPEALDTWEQLLRQATQRAPMLVLDSDKQGDSSPHWRLPSFSAMEDDRRFPTVFPVNDPGSPILGLRYMDVFLSVFDRWAWKNDIILAKITPENILHRCAILSLSAALAIRGGVVDTSLDYDDLRLKSQDETKDGDMLIKGEGVAGDDVGQKLAMLSKDNVGQFDIEMGIGLLDNICETARSLLTEEGRMMSSQRLNAISATSILPELSTDRSLLEGLRLDLWPELEAKPSLLCASSDFKRPINIVNITNYAGKRLSTLLVRWLAYRCQADVVRIDALELSKLVGGHLGQDWAYSKGPISMLGFKVAELNGSLESPIKWPKTSEEDEDEEITIKSLAQWSMHVRSYDSDGDLDDESLFRELSKIKDNPKDYVLPSMDRWQNLKIDKALEGIIRGAKPWISRPTGATSSAVRGLVVHLDDIVELSMTMEGSLLVARLRKIIDDLWLEGYKIAMVGTSSVEKMSERHVAWLRALSVENTVNMVEADNGRKTPWSQTMSQLDFLQANLSNAHTMWVAMAGGGDNVPEEWRILGEFVRKTQAILRYHSATAYFPPETPKRVMGREQWHMIRSKLEALLDVPNLPYTEALTKTIIPPADLFRWVRGYTAASFSEQRALRDLQSHFARRKVRIDHVNLALRAKGKSAEKTEDASSEAQPASKSATQKLVEKLDISDEHEKKLLNGIVDKDEIKTTFKDVHAPPETIMALKLLTSLSLKRPEAFSYGVLARDRIPGCLLYGPPGTGKTLLAKAVAKECGASMLEVSAATINDMWVGQGEKNVQAIFSLAKKMAPLVVFIDEADALLAARSDGGRPRSHREVINQFLREWDGMSDTNAFVMVATNRPFDLDDAVLRRLPRKILVDLPQQKDRRAILDILIRDEQLAPDVDLDALSRDTTLYSGSDLKNLCVAAAMAAVREEVEDADRHASEDGTAPYVYPEKRLLTGRHFALARKEIGASISDDMKTMRAIRKFDETYGKPGRKRGQVLGFGVAGEIQTEARVRKEESTEAGK